MDRWIRAWRAGGFDALIPAERQVAPRTDAEVLELAARLKAAPNQPFEFSVAVPGRVDVELHHLGVTIATINVR